MLQARELGRNRLRAYRRSMGSAHLLGHACVAQTFPKSRKTVYSFPADLGCHSLAYMLYQSYKQDTPPNALRSEV